MPPCRLCQGPLLATGREVEDICVECVTALGLTKLPPPRRPALPCPRCGVCIKFVRVVPRRDITLDNASLWAGTSLSAVRLVFVPDAATYDLSVSSRPAIGAMPAGRAVYGPDLASPRGILSRYICTACGFVDQFCDEPDAIPIGPEYMTDLIVYEPPNK